MRKQYLNPKEIFQSPFFTHTVAVSGAAKIVYMSGQVSYDRDGFVIGKDDVRAQAEQVFKCLTHNLKAASTLVGVKRLAHDDLLLEVEVVAAVEVKDAPKKAKKKKD